MPIKACIVGASGRMGAAIAQVARSDYPGRLEIVSGIEAEGSASVGKTVPGFDNAMIYPASKALKAIESADVSIHFSHPSADIQLIPAIATAGISLVIGTTGFTPPQRNSIDSSIKASQSAAVISPNFSPLVNTQIALAKLASHYLAPLGYDFGLVEEHHNKKLDSPSGTAKKLLDAVAVSGGPSKIMFRGAAENSSKLPGEIDVAVLRLGGTPGLHDLRIVGPHGRLSIESNMYSRSEFASGAIASAIWLCDKNSGHASAGSIFTIEQVLGIV